MRACRLGLKLEEDLAQLGNQKDIDSNVLKAWLQEEYERGCSLWVPARDLQKQDADGEEIDLDRLVEFDDIREWLFPLNGSELKERLMVR